MIPSVRSRLSAAAVSFVLGFAVANVGLVFIERPDQVLWIVLGAVFMVTGALGVLLADSKRRISWWAVLGAEVSLVVILVPILWLFSLALSSDPVTTLWPQNPDKTVFADAWNDGKHAALNTAIVTALAVVIGCALGALGAVATVRGRFAGRGVVTWVLLGALFMPGFALAVPMATQAYAFGMHDQRYYLAVCMLAVTVPLAWWIFDRVGPRLPWSLRDGLKAEGATVIARIWFFWARCVLPPAVGVAAIVFMVAAGDAALAIAITATSDSLTLPAQLVQTGQSSPATTAAIALWWLIPGIIVAALCNRMITDLFTRRAR